MSKNGENKKKGALQLRLPTIYPRPLPLETMMTNAVKDLLTAILDHHLRPPSNGD